MNNDKPPSFTLNFLDTAAARVLNARRFNLTVGGEHVRLFYVVTSKDGMAEVFGAAAYKYCISVKVGCSAAIWFAQLLTPRKHCVLS